MTTNGGNSFVQALANLHEMCLSARFKVNIPELYAVSNRRHS
jgi:hypothetical protein